MKATDSTTRAQLVLDMARRARTPADADAVAWAAEMITRRASREDLHLIEQALKIARTVLDAYLEKRIVDFFRARSG